MENSTHSEGPIHSLVSFIGPGHSTASRPSHRFPGTVTTPSGPQSAGSPTDALANRSASSFAAQSVSEGPNRPNATAAAAALGSVTSRAPGSGGPPPTATSLPPPDPSAPRYCSHTEYTVTLSQRPAPRDAREREQSTSTPPASLSASRSRTEHPRANGSVTTAHDHGKGKTRQHASRGFRLRTATIGDVLVDDASSCESVASSVQQELYDVRVAHAELARDVQSATAAEQRQSAQQLLEDWLVRTEPPLVLAAATDAGLGMSSVGSPRPSVVGPAPRRPVLAATSLVEAPCSHQTNDNAELLDSCSSWDGNDGGAASQSTNIDVSAASMSAGRVPVGRSPRLLGLRAADSIQEHLGHGTAERLGGGPLPPRGRGSNGSWSSDSGLDEEDRNCAVDVERVPMAAAPVDPTAVLRARPPLSGSAAAGPCHAAVEPLDVRWASLPAIVGSPVAVLCELRKKVEVTVSSPTLRRAPSFGDGPNALPVETSVVTSTVVRKVEYQGFLVAALPEHGAIVGGSGSGGMLLLAAVTAFHAWPGVSTPITSASASTQTCDCCGRDRASAAASETVAPRACRGCIGRSLSRPVVGGAPCPMFAHHLPKMPPATAAASPRHTAPTTGPALTDKIGFMTIAMDRVLELRALEDPRQRARFLALPAPALLHCTPAAHTDGSGSGGLLSPTSPRAAPPLTAADRRAAHIAARVRGLWAAQVASTCVRDATAPVYRCVCRDHNAINGMSTSSGAKNTMPPPPPSTQGRGPRDLRGLRPLVHVLAPVFFAWRAHPRVAALAGTFTLEQVTDGLQHLRTALATRIADAESPFAAADFGGSWSASAPASPLQTHDPKIRTTVAAALASSMPHLLMGAAALPVPLLEPLALLRALLASGVAGSPSATGVGMVNARQRRGTATPSAIAADISMASWSTRFAAPSLAAAHDHSPAELLAQCAQRTNILWQCAERRRWAAAHPAPTTAETTTTTPFARTFGDFRRWLLHVALVGAATESSGMSIGDLAAVLTPAPPAGKQNAQEVRHMQDLRRRWRALVRRERCAVVRVMAERARRRRRYTSKGAGSGGMSHSLRSLSRSFEGAPSMAGGSSVTSRPLPHGRRPETSFSPFSKTLSATSAPLTPPMVARTGGANSSAKYQRTTSWRHFRQQTTAHGTAGRPDEGPSAASGQAEPPHAAADAAADALADTIHPLLFAAVDTELSMVRSFHRSASGGAAILLSGTCSCRACMDTASCRVQGSRCADGAKAERLLADTAFFAVKRADFDHQQQLACYILAILSRVMPPPTTNPAATATASAPDSSSEATQDMPPIEALAVSEVFHYAAAVQKHRLRPPQRPGRDHSHSGASRLPTVGSGGDMPADSGLLSRTMSGNSAVLRAALPNFGVGGGPPSVRTTPRLAGTITGDTVVAFNGGSFAVPAISPMVLPLPHPAVTPHANTSFGSLPGAFPRESVVMGTSATIPGAIRTRTSTIIPGHLPSAPQTPALGPSAAMNTSVPSLPPSPQKGSGTVGGPNGAPLALPSFADFAGGSASETAFPHPSRSYTNRPESASFSPCTSPQLVPMMPAHQRPPTHQLHGDPHNDRQRDAHSVSQYTTLLTLMSGSGSAPSIQPATATNSPSDRALPRLASLPTNAGDASAKATFAAEFDRWAERLLQMASSSAANTYSAKLSRAEHMRGAVDIVANAVAAWLLRSLRDFLRADSTLRRGENVSFSHVMGVWLHSTVLWGPWRDACPNANASQAAHPDDDSPSRSAFYIGRLPAPVLAAEYALTLLAGAFSSGGTARARLRLAHLVHQQLAEREEVLAARVLTCRVPLPLPAIACDALSDAASRQVSAKIVRVCAAVAPHIVSAPPHSSRTIDGGSAKPPRDAGEVLVPVTQIHSGTAAWMRFRGDRVLIPRPPALTLAPATCVLPPATMAGLTLCLAALCAPGTDPFAALCLTLVPPAEESVEELPTLMCPGPSSLRLLEALTELFAGCHHHVHSTGSPTASRRPSAVAFSDPDPQIGTASFAPAIIAASSELWGTGAPASGLRPIGVPERLTMSAIADDSFACSLSLACVVAAQRTAPSARAPQSPNRSPLIKAATGDTATQISARGVSAAALLRTTMLSAATIAASVSPPPQPTAGAPQSLPVSTIIALRLALMTGDAAGSAAEICAAAYETEHFTHWYGTVFRPWRARIRHAASMNASMATTHVHFGGGTAVAGASTTSDAILRVVGPPGLAASVTGTNSIIARMDRHVRLPCLVGAVLKMAFMQPTGIEARPAGAATNGQPNGGNGFGAANALENLLPSAISSRRLLEDAVFLHRILIGDISGIPAWWWMGPDPPEVPPPPMSPANGNSSTTTDQTMTAAGASQSESQQTGGPLLPERPPTVPTQRQFMEWLVTGRASLPSEVRRRRPHAHSVTARQAAVVAFSSFLDHNTGTPFDLERVRLLASFLLLNTTGTEAGALAAAELLLLSDREEDAEPDAALMDILTDVIAMRDSLNNPSSNSSRRRAREGTACCRTCLRCICCWMCLRRCLREDATPDDELDGYDGYHDDDDDDLESYYQPYRRRAEAEEEEEQEDDVSTAIGTHQEEREGSEQSTPAARGAGSRSPDDEASRAVERRLAQHGVHRLLRLVASVDPRTNAAEIDTLPDQLQQQLTLLSSLCRSRLTSQFRNPASRILRRPLDTNQANRRRSSGAATTGRGGAASPRRGRSLFACLRIRRHLREAIVLTFAANIMNIAIASLVCFGFGVAMFQTVESTSILFATRGMASLLSERYSRVYATSLVCCLAMFFTSALWTMRVAGGRHWEFVAVACSCVYIITGIVVIGLAGYELSPSAFDGIGLFQSRLGSANDVRLCDFYRSEGCSGRLTACKGCSSSPPADCTACPTCPELGGNESFMTVPCGSAFQQRMVAFMRTLLLTTVLPVILTAVGLIVVRCTGWKRWSRRQRRRAQRRLQQLEEEEEAHQAANGGPRRR